MRRWIKFALVITIVTFLAACAGRNFEMPHRESLNLGKTTYNEILQRFGKPYQEGTVLKNGTTLKTISYAYSATTSKGIFPDVVPARAVGFYFKNNILVGHEFTSSFKDDSTYFDAIKISHIKKGETTFDQITALLGNRYGECVYPLTKNKEESGIIYLYNQYKGSGFKSNIYQQTLVCSFNKQGIVTDIFFTASGNL